MHCPLSRLPPKAGGRYLNDTWALNLENLTWRAFVSAGRAGSGALPASATPQGGAAPLPPLMPIAGHVAVPWHGNVVLVGGHMKVCGYTAWVCFSEGLLLVAGREQDTQRNSIRRAAQQPRATNLKWVRCCPPTLIAGKGRVARDACAPAGHQVGHLVGN